MIAPIQIVTDDLDVLPDIRDTFSRFPETRYLEPYELQGALRLLGYTDAFADEAEISATMQVARGDWDPDGAAA